MKKAIVALARRLAVIMHRMWVGRTEFRWILRSLDMSYFAVDGLVSGIKSPRIAAPSKATAAILRNAAVRPKLRAIRPKSAVLSAAPIPDAVPMMP